MNEFIITEADVGKLFKDKSGDVLKVVYVHPDSTTLPVTAVNTEDGVASNYQLNGQFLVGKTSEYDLVERYKPMSWEEFCENVMQWATDRGIIANSTPRAQIMKGLIGYGELVEAVLNDDRDEVVYAIGDILVCLVIAACIAGRDLSSELRQTVLPITPSYALAGSAEVLGKLLMSIDNSDYDLAVWRIQELAKALEVDFKECLEATWDSIKDFKGCLNE